MRIKSPLKFIRQKGLIEFDITFVNGFHVLKTKTFKQIIKKSEYDKIMAHQVEAPKKEKAETKKQKAAREKAEAKAEKDAEAAEEQAKKDAEAPPLDEEPAI